MICVCLALFGVIVMLSIVVPQPTTDNAQLISESVAPGTQEAAGVSFTEVVTMKNTGTSTWTGGARAEERSGGGEAQFGERTFYERMDQSSVSPGALGT